MLRNATHLNFKEISDMWARENADHPAGLSRDEILARILDGLRNDEFDRDELTILRKHSVDANSFKLRRPAGWQPVTRDMLDFLFRDFSDSYDKRNLEELKISKKGFRQWCKKRGYLLPKFWFAPINSDAPPEADDRLRGSARYEDWEKRQTSLKKDGKATNLREAAEILV